VRLTRQEAQRRFGVLLKCPVTARRGFHPNHALPVEKIQQHLLVISAQAERALGIRGAQIEHVLDTARHVRAAIDQVAEKDQLVSGLVAREHVEQVEQLRAAAVYVANDEGFHICCF